MNAIAYDLPAAAKALCLSTRTLRRKIASGELRAVRCGGKLLLACAEVERFMASLPDAVVVANDAAQTTTKASA